MPEPEQMRRNGYSTLAYVKSPSQRKRRGRPCGIRGRAYLSNRHSETPTPPNQSANDQWGVCSESESYASYKHPHWERRPVRNCAFVITHALAHAACWHRYSLQPISELKSRNTDSFILSAVHSSQKIHFKSTEKKSEKRWWAHFKCSKSETCEHVLTVLSYVVKKKIDLYST